VAVAVSIGQLVDGDQLFNAVAGALEAAGLRPERLELQLTEGSLATPDATVPHTLQRLRDSGVRIAMDVFGTGSLALSQPGSFPFSKITIDQSFIAGLGADEQAGVASRAIAMLGAALGMNTKEAGDRTAARIAPDNPSQRSAIEGFLIGRPIRAAEIGALLSKYAPAQDIIPITA
jgi:EAL domain-containing protein (putative c-di-GMP-specific phosphodiesterase class I)